MNTLKELEAVLYQLANLKKLHICENFPLMTNEAKAKKCEKIDRITAKLFQGLITVDEAAEAIAKA